MLLHGAVYHPFGPVSQWLYGNGRLMTRTRNLNGQPGIVQDTAAGGISLGYEFDVVGNLKVLRDGDQNETPKWIYDYDKLDRLTATRDSAIQVPLQEYGYDKTGNRTSRTQAGVATANNYVVNRHRLASVGGVARSYDNAGNTTGIALATAKQFVYGDHGRMVQYKEAGTTKMTYQYSGRGEQVYRFGSGSPTLSLYNDAGYWMGDYKGMSGGSIAPIQQVIWMDGLPVGVMVGATPGVAAKLHYIQADALGTPRVIIDPVRDVAVWRWELSGEAFGDSAPNQDPDGDATPFVFDLRFPGQRYDAVSGLNYNYFRDYEPGTGRYVQSDPIGLSGGMSTYGYVGGNSLTSIDLFGLQASGNFYVFGIHTQVTADRALGSGHSWISVRETGSQATTTYGAWQDGLAATVGPTIPNNGSASDVRVNFEASHGYRSPTQSMYFLLSQDQKNRLDAFLKRDFQFGEASNNCTDFVKAALLETTSINIGSASSILGIDAPSLLSYAIDDLSKYADTKIKDGNMAASLAAQRQIIHGPPK